MASLPKKKAGAWGQVLHGHMRPLSGASWLVHGAAPCQAPAPGICRGTRRAARALRPRGSRQARGPAGAYDTDPTTAPVPRGACADVHGPCDTRLRPTWPGSSLRTATKCSAWCGPSRWTRAIRERARRTRLPGMRAHRAHAGPLTMCSAPIPHRPAQSSARPLPRNGGWFCLL
jgi:hypothetical protein